MKEARPIKGQSSSKTQTMDRVCLYLRLFMGMGVIWYFEIISWAVGSEAQEWTYFFDCFNMLQVISCVQKRFPLTILQGVWVFFTFVCKRNVLKVVLKKSDHLYSVVRKSTMDNTGTIFH